MTLLHDLHGQWDMSVVILVTVKVRREGRPIDPTRADEVNRKMGEKCNMKSDLNHEKNLDEIYVSRWDLTHVRRNFTGFFGL